MAFIRRATKLQERREGIAADKRGWTEPRVSGRVWGL